MKNRYTVEVTGELARLYVLAETGKPHPSLKSYCFDGLRTQDECWRLALRVLELALSKGDPFPAPCNASGIMRIDTTTGKRKKLR